jgi:hypothetical protein
MFNHSKSIDFFCLVGYKDQSGQKEEFHIYFNCQFSDDLCKFFKCKPLLLKEFSDREKSSHPSNLHALAGEQIRDLLIFVYCTFTFPLSHSGSPLDLICSNPFELF